MLRQTFCHVPGLGPQAERKLWAAGFDDWRAVLAATAIPGSAARGEQLRRCADESECQLANGNPHYFGTALASREHWRLFPHFRARVAYLDIETTGTQPGVDVITTIGLYDGQEVRYYVNGANLERFVDDIQAYDVLVSYNGKSFDLPFIERFFGCSIRAVHLDLRHILASLGLKGGLKGCEVALGLDRGELAGVDGFFAVLLWRDFHYRGNRRALETLIAYNLEDVVNLEHLMVVAYNRKVAETPFAAALTLPLPTRPAIPFGPDAETIHRLRRRHGL